jgi:predicted RND superfamily exporter protein
LRFLYRPSIHHPKTVLVLAALVTLSIVPSVRHLRLRTDGHALVPADAPAVRYDQAIREEFGVEDPIVVVIHSDQRDGIFNVHTLELVRDLTADFGRMPGIRAANLFSLATEHSSRVVPGTLRFRRFLEPVPQTPAELGRLREDLRRIRLYTGTLVSSDEHDTTIMIGTPGGADRTGMYEAVQAIIAARRLGGNRACPERIRVIGAPVAEALLGTHILQDLGVPARLLEARLERGDVGDAAPWPGSLADLRLVVARHVGLLPLSIGMMLVVFLVSFRRPAAALLPLLEVGACIAVVFGLMGWFGVPVYLTVAVMPVILIVTGVADEIHVFKRFTQERNARPGAGAADVVMATMDEMWLPMIKTAVTTAVGFLSFALSPMQPVSVFGLFSSAGVIFCMIWSLTVIPASLVLLPAGWLAPRRAARGDAGGSVAARWLARGGALIIRHRYVVLGLTVLAVALCPLGIRRAAIQDSWIDSFARGSAFRQAIDSFNGQFLGMHTLLVSVDTGNKMLAGEIDPRTHDGYPLRIPAGGIDDPARLVGWHVRLRPARGSGRPAAEWSAWIQSAALVGDEVELALNKSYRSLRRQFRLTGSARVRYEITPRYLDWPDVLHAVSALEDFIATRRDCAVGGVIGPADYVETTSFIMGGNKEERRCIPDSREKVAWVWNRYEATRGAERLRQVINPSHARGLIAVYLRNANFIDTARLMTAIRDYEQAHLRTPGITLGFAGDVAVSQTLIDAIVSTQLRSLWGSLVGIFAVTAILSRSLRAGLYCLVPCCLAVLATFATMGWAHIPIGVATSMFSAMTLGIGIDYAIYLQERYRLARARDLSHEAALVDAIGEAGPAIIIDAISVALGFGIMVVSQVPANAWLGALVALGMLACLVGTLVVLPALPGLWVRRGAGLWSAIARGRKPEPAA